jgi:hypothetical protein
VFESRQARPFRQKSLKEGELMKTTHKWLAYSSWLRAAAACLVLATVSVGCLGRGLNTSSRAVIQPQPDSLERAPSQFRPGPARIVSVNPELQFVVVDFSSRVMPPVGTRLNVYRGDQKIGAVQITEPVRARLATADIVQGEVRVGDEAR